MSDFDFNINNNMIKIIEKFGHDYIRAGDEKHVRYNCPFCLSRRGKADSDHKFYVNFRKGAFWCFKCHARGRLGGSDNESKDVYKLLEMMKPDYSEDSEELDNDDEGDNVFYLPHVDIPDDTEAYKYLSESRHINRELIEYYNIRLGVGDLFGRVVVPNTLYGNEGIWTDMYSARSYIGQSPKYLNPDGAKKTDSVFNIQRTNKKGRVYIVEGVMTAINAGKEGICTYGSSPSDKQLAKIVDMDYEEMYCVYDNDPSGRHGNEELADKLSKMITSGTLYTVLMPEGIDAADMGEEKFQAYVQDHKVKYYSSVYSKLFMLFKK